MRNWNGWQVSSGVNLYIDISTACNASCKFCIAPIVGRKDQDTFFDGAVYALDLMQEIDGTVQIVGGEPMISSRLRPLLNLLQKRTIRRSVLNTNGSRLTNRNIVEIAEAGIRHLNISRHHHDESRNQEIMLIRPMVTNRDIHAAIAQSIANDIAVRAQCNLISGFVDSIDEIDRYLSWASACGCREVSFSQVFPLSLFDYQIPQYPGYTENAQVDLSRIIMALDLKYERYIPNPTDNDSMTQWGQSNWIGASEWQRGGKRRFWVAPNGLKFSLKTLAGYDKEGNPLPTAYAKSSDWEISDNVFAFAVLHSDGIVSASWDKKERILYNPTVSVQLVA